MTKWEYLTHYAKYIYGLGYNGGKDIVTIEDINNINKMLVNSGQQGWELVSVTPIANDGKTRELLFTFKRPMQE